MSEIVVAASGYFDPLHVGHIECLEMAKKLGDKLVVIVNNAEQTKAKKGFEFMPFKERIKIMNSLKIVDEVFESIDEDSSVCESLAKIKPNIFAKGGDRNVGNIPEKEIREKYNIKIIDGLGEKIQASSELIKNARENGHETNID